MFMAYWINVIMRLINSRMNAIFLDESIVRLELVSPSDNDLRNVVYINRHQNSAHSILHSDKSLLKF